jgi:hypothetical protein
VKTSIWGIFCDVIFIRILEIQFTIWVEFQFIIKALQYRALCFAGVIYKEIDRTMRYIKTD